MAFLAVMFIVVPLVELYVIVQVSHQIGLGNALGLLLVVSLTGAWLVKHEGLRVWRQFRAEAAAGRVPSRSIADGVLVLLAGVLLLAPGFVTDAIGLVLLLPPVRAGIRPLLLRRFVGASTVVRAHVVDTVVHEEPVRGELER
jgi:UPF0716 protein FxsA